MLYILIERVDWQWEVEVAENNMKLEFCVISFFSPKLLKASEA